VDTAPSTRTKTAGEASDDAVIRATQLTKVYTTGVKAVDALDLEVRTGEIFGLLGPNGAGKTTTVGMLTTRVIPTSGSAIVAGIDVVADPPSAKARVGVVSQTNTLDRSLTVRENLYFHGRYFGMGARAAARTADALLELFRFRPGRRRRLHPVRRDGTASAVRPGGGAPARGPVPGRADIRA
jgi:ABC-2 type transport system ATP-binding protein